MEQFKPRIISHGAPGIYEGAEPDELARIHPLWKRFVETCGPWSRATSRLPVFEGNGRVTQNRLIICGECASSMDAALHLFEQKEICPWDAVWAVSQPAGRGRKGRIWRSPPGNLYAAWIWPPAPEDLSTLIPLTAGLVVSRALDSFGVHCLIKWPNDLLIDDRKIGGILVEKRGDLVIVGIGLNLSWAPPDGMMRVDGAVRAGVVENGSAIDLVAFWNRMLAEAKTIFSSVFDSNDAAKMLRKIENRLAWRGKTVKIIPSASDRAVYEAYVAGLADDGGLIVASDTKQRVLRSETIMPIDAD